MRENQKKNIEIGLSSAISVSPHPSAKALASGSSLRIPLFLTLTLFVPLVDQLSKWIVINKMSLYESFPIISGLLSVTRIHNSGIAFGFFPGLPKLFLAVTVLSMFVVLYFYLTTQPRTLLLTLGCALILGGAAGNLLDRVHYGYVVDFIYFNYSRFGLEWPAFNIADSSVSAGVALLLFNFFVEKKGTKEHASNPV